MSVFLIATLLVLSGCACKYHDLKEEIITEATCKVNGIKREYCTRCDYTLEESISGSHDFQKEEILREATCDIDGKSIYKCVECEETKEFTKPAEHLFYERTCIRCGYEKPLPELSVGMSKFEVELKWGEPIEIDKSTSSRGTSETWWYKENGKTVAVNFDVDGKVWLISQ